MTRDEVVTMAVRCISNHLKDKAKIATATNPEMYKMVATAMFLGAAESILKLAMIMDNKDIAGIALELEREGAKIV